MTSSVNIFSAVNRKSGGLAVSVEGKQMENTPQRALQREGSTLPTRTHQGYCLWRHRGLSYVRTTKTCPYMTSRMQAGGGWLGHLRVHIQYTCLRKKIHSWLQLKSGWCHAVWCRCHNPTIVSVNLSGWAEFRSFHSFFIYIKLLHCSNL